MSDLAQYDYELPRGLIAQLPLSCRSDARLLVVDRKSGTIAHRHVRDLSEMLQPGDRLVLNDTKVVPASLSGVRTATGGRWQGLFLEATEEGLWRLLSRTRGKLRPGETVTLFSDNSREDLQLTLVSQLEDRSWVAKPGVEEDAFVLLDRVGRVPLPHYIRGGQMVAGDRASYQTVYAEKRGAVAAPTAGLHFTESVFKDLSSRKVDTTKVTLHVGLGTFRPITAESLDGHAMHSEWADISSDAVAELLACRQAGGRIVAVGTTAVRVLETAAANGSLQPYRGNTDLFIRPPYEFRGVDALMTNFHLPRTTLLVLVRTFGGDELIRHAYQEAIRDQYRFYSYGDAMLIL